MVVLLSLSYSLPVAQSSCGGWSFTTDVHFGLGCCVAFAVWVCAQWMVYSPEIFIATVACGCWGLKVRT